MKLSDVRKFIEKGGIPCYAWKAPKEASAPYAVALKTGSGKITHADNGMWYTPMRVVVLLALYPDDEETEYRMDDILNNRDINFEYEMYLTEDENYCCKVYSFEVEED